MVNLVIVNLVIVYVVYVGFFVNIAVSVNIVVSVVSVSGESFQLLLNNICPRVIIGLLSPTT